MKAGGFVQVSPKHEYLVYSGRIDFSHPEAPVFIYPGSFVRMCFTGDHLAVKVRNRRLYWDNYLGYILDGVQGKLLLGNRGETESLEIPVTEKKEKHELLLFKRQDGCHCYSLYGFELGADGGVCPSVQNPQRRMEVYGDSISAGELSEAVEYTGRPDPVHNGEYSNSWYSYAWIAARKLHAQLHNVSQGGIPLLNGNGWVEPPFYPGMEYMWDKLQYHPGFGEVSSWDFSRYTPHLVLIAVGQNDSNPDDYMRQDLTGVRAVYWKYKYQKLVEELRRQYPKALILLATSIMEHAPGWDDAIGEVCRGMKDERVRHFLYSRNGCGTPGHVRIPEAEEMAEELVDYIEHLDIPVWED